jgi:hypothetical protein
MPVCVLSEMRPHPIDAKVDEGRISRYLDYEENHSEVYSFCVKSPPY